MNIDVYKRKVIELMQGNPTTEMWEAVAVSVLEMSESENSIQVRCIDIAIGAPIYEEATDDPT